MAPIDTNLLPVEIARKMMWHNKQKWFIGAAAILLLSIGAVGFQYWSAKTAFASTQEEAAKNTSAMGDALNAKKKWPSAGMSQFDTDKGQIDQLMGLAQARTIWPALTLDILGALPQAKNPAAVKTPGSRLVVLTRITSDYNGVLSSVSTTGAVFVPVTTPDQPPTDGAVDPNTVDNPAPTVAAANPNGPKPGQVGPSDHGFVVTIIGYSPPVPGTKTYEIPREYLTALMNRAGFDAAHPLNPTNKPYYFSDPGFGGQVVPAPIPGAAAPSTSSGPWGATQGPFAPIFAPEIAAFKPTTQPAIPGTDAAPIQTSPPASADPSTPSSAINKKAPNSCTVISNSPSSSKSTYANKC